MTILTKVNHENQAQIVRCKLISVALLSIISPSAYADELKVSPFLSASLTYDDNVYLLADEEDEIQIIGQDQRSDTIINAGIGVNGKYDSRSSNIKFGARVFRRDHTDFEVLDFTERVIGNLASAGKPSSDTGLSEINLILAKRIWHKAMYSTHTVSTLA